MDTPDPSQVQSLVDYFSGRQPEILESIRELIERESPTSDKKRLDALAVLLAERLQVAGAEVDIIANDDCGNFLHARLAGAVPAVPAALIVGHFDTVWPVGTLERLPFRIENNTAFGPGIFDMKASLVLVEYALRAIGDLELPLPRPLEIFLSADEEAGSLKGRPHVEERAREAEYVLVVEPPLPGGCLKTARKGVGYFLMEVEGRSAHAGIEPEKGISAIQELAHQILYLGGLSDLDQGSTVNVGIIGGGTTPNVVPATARAEIDVRVWSGPEAERIERAIRESQPVTPGTSLRVTGRMKRPPMERSEEIADLFAKAREIGRQLDLDLQEGSTGGGSDGNFSAALGIPTLDGLGAPGRGAHAEDEQILIDELPRRGALIALLLLNI